MLFDKFSMRIGEQQWGPIDAAVVLTPEWTGKLPPVSKPNIIERRGVDLNPLNPSQPEDALRLISYIWPDQTDRISRTRAAMAFSSPQVDAGDAIDWLEKRLSNPLTGTLHLIYHTIAWQYFPLVRKILGKQLIETAGRAATSSSPIAWLSMEADDIANGAALVLRLWPGDICVSLGRAGFHGQWVDWRPQ